MTLRSTKAERLIYSLFHLATFVAATTVRHQYQQWILEDTLMRDLSHGKLDVSAFNQNLTGRATSLRVVVLRLTSGFFALAALLVVAVLPAVDQPFGGGAYSVLAVYGSTVSIFSSLTNLWSIRQVLRLLTSVCPVPDYYCLPYIVPHYPLPHSIQVWFTDGHRRVCPYRVLQCWLDRAPRDGHHSHHQHAMGM